MTKDGFDDEPEVLPWSGPVRRPLDGLGASAPRRRTSAGRHGKRRAPRLDGLGVLLDAAHRRTEVLRRRARSPWARRIARGRAGAVLAAAAVAVCVGVLVRDADEERSRWGRTLAVAVVRGDHEAGDEIHRDSIELQTWPAGLVPHTAVREVPEGRRFAAAVADGEVLVAARVARPGAGSAAARLPEGRAAVTVPLGPAPPPLEVGDLVDVLAPPQAQTEPWEVASDVPAEVVAASAEVIAVQEGHATLVVDRADVERTAAAILNGTLALALTG